MQLNGLIQGLKKITSVPETKDEAREILKKGGVIRTSYCGRTSYLRSDVNDPAHVEVYPVAMQGRFDEGSQTILKDVERIHISELPEDYTYQEVYESTAAPIKATDQVQAQVTPTQKLFDGYWRIKSTGRIGKISSIELDADELIEPSDLEKVEVSVAIG